MQERDQLRARAGKLAPFPLSRFEQFLSSCQIQSKEYGQQRLALYQSQRYILTEIVKGIAEGQSTFVILKARQLGASTFFLALDLFWCFEHPGLSAAFATHEEKSAVKFRSIVDTMLTFLPRKYKVPKKRHNRDILILNNGSTLSYLIAGTKKGAGKAGGLGKSTANNFVHATEVAFWGNEDDVRELKATAAQHNPFRMQIWESTANGFNHFHEMWEVAKESPTQRAIFVGWWLNDSYRFEVDHPFYAAFDREPNAAERQRMRAVKEQYGYDIMPEQLAWYRWCLEDEQKGDQDVMDERYPWTEDDAFQATGSKFFRTQALTAAMRGAKKIPMTPFRYQLYKDWEKTELIPLRDHKRAELKIYESPVPNGVYVLGCDPAYGSSEENDSTAMCVLRCYADVAIQVAEFCSPRVATYEAAWILCHLAGYYKNVKVNLEITGPGTAVQGEIDSVRTQLRKSRATLQGGFTMSALLQMMTYFLDRRPDSLSGNFMLHTKTSSEIKEFMANSFRDSFHLGRLQIKSIYLLEEMKTIVREDNWIGGANKKPDDRFMAAVLAHQSWRVWEQPKLIAMGRTFAKEAADATRPPSGRQVEAMVINYLKTARIELPKETVSVAGGGTLPRRPDPVSGV